MSQEIEESKLEFKKNQNESVKRYIGAISESDWMFCSVSQL